MSFAITHHAGMLAGESVAPIIELSLLVVMVSNSASVEGSRVGLGMVALAEVVEVALADTEELVEPDGDDEPDADVEAEAEVIEVFWDVETTVDAAFSVVAL